MTDRYRSLTVFLDDDYRNEEEGLGRIIDAIHMVETVDSVYRGEIHGHAQRRAEREYERKKGLIICAVAMDGDEQFHEDVEAAYQRFQQRLSNTG